MTDTITPDITDAASPRDASPVDEDLAAALALAKRMLTRIVAEMRIDNAAASMEALILQARRWRALLRDANPQTPPSYITSDDEDGEDKGVFRGSRVSMSRGDSIAVQEAGDPSSFVSRLIEEGMSAIREAQEQRDQAVLIRALQAARDSGDVGMQMMLAQRAGLEIPPTPESRVERIAKVPSICVFPAPANDATDEPMREPIEGAAAEGA